MSCYLRLPSDFSTGKLRWTYPHDHELRLQLHASSVGDNAIRETIVRHARDHGEVFCPHTATAMHVLDGMGSTGLPWAVVATAHPAKFDSVVEPLIGRQLDVPPALEAMVQRPAYAEPISANDDALKAWLDGRVASARAAAG